MFKNSLSELFSEEDKLVAELQKPVLIFDMFNLAYRTVFSSLYQSPEDNGEFKFWKHLFTNSLFRIIDKFQPSKVILAYDVRNTWRYDHYSGYKQNRKASREKAVVDFDKFFPVLNELKEDIKETFTTIYTLECPKAEADDIIAILVKNIFRSNQNIIISSDKDLNQLLTEKNNKQYDPIGNKMMNCINPKRELDLKVIIGDKSDTIPAIKSRTGRATAEKILKSGLDDFLDKPENKEIKENYKRNRMLIDFNYIPKDVHNTIINTYSNYQIKDIEGSKIMKFFTKHKLMKLMDEWNTYSPLFKSLK